MQWIQIHTWFFLSIASLRSRSASHIWRFLSSTWWRLSLSRCRSSSMRRLRSSSFCSRNFWAANACCFSSSNFLCLSSFCRSRSARIFSSRSFCDRCEPSFPGNNHNEFKYTIPGVVSPPLEYYLPKQLLEQTEFTWLQ